MDDTASWHLSKGRHMNADIWIELLVVVLRIIAGGLAG